MSEIKKIFFTCPMQKTCFVDASNEAQLKIFSPEKLNHQEVWVWNNQNKEALLLTGKLILHSDYPTFLNRFLTLNLSQEKEGKTEILNQGNLAFLNTLPAVFNIQLEPENTSHLLLNFQQQNLSFLQSQKINHKSFTYDWVFTLEASNEGSLYEANSEQKQLINENEEKDSSNKQNKNFKQEENSDNKKHDIETSSQNINHLSTRAEKQTVIEFANSTPKLNSGDNNQLQSADLQKFSEKEETAYALKPQVLGAKTTSFSWINYWILILPLLFIFLLYLLKKRKAKSKRTNC